jgi:hypothetical protein
MSRKGLFISVLGFVVLLNSAVLGTLYMAGIIWQPSVQELEAIRLAEEALQKEADQAIKYAHLEPLPEFKSKANYVKSMGEAINICETALHEKVPVRKSWAVNHIESRFLPHIEQYKVFLDYETIAVKGEEIKKKKVTCEVEEATKIISNWKAM